MASLLYTTQDLYMTTLSWATLAVFLFLGFSEISGKHLGYSKFVHLGFQNKAKIPAKIGMLILYTPSFLAGVASLTLIWIHHHRCDVRFTLLSLALTIHYFKRDFEVLFIHKYSGEMAISSTILICLSYTSSTLNVIYFNYKLLSSPNYENVTTLIDLKYIGFVLFLLGISGNFYHHFLLSKLRVKGEEKSYKIPKGGLFGLVICPHYFFEIIGFLGISFISQTLYGYSFMIGTIFYLMGRSYATRKWYVSKFEDFPRHVKALIPFIF